MKINLPTDLLKKFELDEDKTRANITIALDLIDSATIARYQWMEMEDCETAWLSLMIWLKNLSIDELVALEIKYCDLCNEEPLSLITMENLLISYHLDE